jgi:ubiquitin-protein ligase
MKRRNAVSGSERDKRLAAELESLQALAKQSSIFEFEASGNPPERYTITFRGRGIKRTTSYDDQVDYIDRHQCEIRLGSGFPEQPPEVRWLTPILHPNISYSGYLNLKDCGVAWQKDLTLDVVCERLWDLARLAWVDLETATNFSAKNWFGKQRDIALPTDARPLRSGAGPSAANVIRYTRGPAPAPPTTADGVLYIGEDTPAPELPRGRPTRPRTGGDDDVLYIGDE